MRQFLGLMCLFCIVALSCGSDENPVQLDPLDFRFKPSVVSPKSAVEAEGRAFRDKLQAKYEGKLVLAVGVFANSNTGIISFKIDKRGPRCTIYFADPQPTFTTEPSAKPNTYVVNRKSYTVEGVIKLGDNPSSPVIINAKILPLAKPDKVGK